MRFLVLGADGMAGHTISLYLKECGHSVIGYTMRPYALVEKNIVGDATDEASFVAMIADEQYDIVINCIGLLNQVADNNPSKAVYLNSYIPHLVADTIKDTNKRLFHMSTDCVFSGKTGHYTEDSLRDGETFYDRTKALGEIEDDKNLTFRNSIIGPDINENGMGLFNWFMKQTGPLTGYTKSIWTGVTTLTLAKAMERAATEGLTGLYNLVNNDSINKHDLIMLFNKYFKEGKIEIAPVDGIVADKSLYRTRNDFSYTVPSYEEMVADMKAWVDAHQELYPHYFK